jgi:hypothetical protein
MKKRIMQSTIKIEGMYGVEVGDYAVIMEDGSVMPKPLWEGLAVEESREGKIEVTESALMTAETVRLDREWLEESKKELAESSGDPDVEFVTEGDGGFLGYSEEDQEDDSPSNSIVVTANMKLDGKLGWEYFPGYYLFEDGTFASPYNPLPEGEVESAEGEFTADLGHYVDATSNAEKLRYIAEAERLGIRGYID